jgi:hypothetical protein
MEFEEMKKIWDSQKQEHVFSLDQSALHNRVLTKQKQGLHIAHISELLLIFSNILGAASILAVVIPRERFNISMTIMSVCMLMVATYVARGRYQRINGNAKFDRSLKGDLEFALDVARYQVKLSTLGRWIIFPVATLSVTGLIEAEKSFWIVLAIIFFMLLLNYFAGWESKYYQTRLNQLEALKKKLEE